MDLEYSWFKRKILEQTGVDLNSYRPVQMRRIVDKLVDKAGARNYVDYVKKLQANPDMIQEFRDSMTINVSHLFRDLERWNDLKDLLPALVDAAGDRTVRAWSAGCSIGAEPYTLAVLFQELARRRQNRPFSFSILCSDIDNSMLDRARDGVFIDKETREVPPALLNRYFKNAPPPRRSWARACSADVFFGAVPALKKNLDFKNHNLLNDPWDSGFDLIVCRNLLIYFNNDVKEELFHKFQDALLPGGMLFIGATEVIFSPSKYGLSSVNTGIYRKDC